MTHMMFHVNSRYFVHFIIFLQMNPKGIERKKKYSDSEKNFDEDEGNLQNTAV